MLSTSLRNKYAKVSGTSQAAPLTAGWLAFLMSHGLGTDDLFTYLQPLDVNNLGAGVIDPAAMCADQCTLDYATLDYSGDGIVNDQDLYVVNEWLEDNFTDN